MKDLEAKLFDKKLGQAIQDEVDKIGLDDALDSLSPRPHAFPVAVNADDGILRWGGPEDEKPTLEELKTERDRLQVLFDNSHYHRNRAKEYPRIEEQLDMIYKDNLNSTTTHKDAVEVVKTKWPKDNSGPV